MGAERFAPNDHAALSTLRQLRDRRARDARGLFVAEGLRFLLRALQTGSDIRQIIVCRALAPPGIHHALRQAHTRRIPILEVSAASAKNLSCAGEGRGILMVIAQTTCALARPTKRTTGWVALSEVSGPGNLGSIVRTVAAAGLEGLILLGDLPDPWHPTAVRATMGALFDIKIIRSTHARVGRWAHQHHCLIAGATADARLPYYKARFQRPTVIIVGGEKRGLSPADYRLAQLPLSIPMNPPIDSLNVAVATAVVAFELKRQHQQKGHSASR